MMRVSLDKGFQVEPGRPKDIFFFISEVVSGAWRAHFGNQFSSLPMTEKEFGMRCSKAILEQLLPFWRPTITQQFVVIRHNHEIVGAALSQTNTHQGTRPLTSIDVVVVATEWRRQGVGQTLVTYFQKCAPPGAMLECYCLPKSRVMARLVKRLGFVRTHKAMEYIKGDEEMCLLPERWEWQAQCASQSFDPNRLTATIENERIEEQVFAINHAPPHNA